MAPVDRREHRQQRVRGAGPSSVQASFGFNFGALDARPAKQTSLPPQRSSRRTPVQNTPRALNASAQRHRSASLQRSSSSKRKGTPNDRTVTPQLGKRKRGSPHGQPGADNGEEDELSPDREEIVRSIEKSRRVVGTVSPIREEIDEPPDELSILDEGGSAARKSALDTSAFMNGTPVSVLAKKSTSSSGATQKTPIADRIGSMTVTSRQSISRRSKSTDPGPITPGLIPNGPPRLSSASRFGPAFDTPGAAPAEEESEDELSPPQTNGTTPRIITKDQQARPAILQDDEVDVDELSSPMQPTPVQETSTAQSMEQALKPSTEPPIEGTTVSLPAKRGRPRRVVEDEADGVTTTVASIIPTQRGRPKKPLEPNEVAPKATPPTRKPGKRREQRLTMEDEEQIDELSPETDRVTQRREISAKRKHNVVEVSDAEEDSDVYEDPDPEEEPEVRPRPVSKRLSPKQMPRVKPSSEKPLRKRHKFLGPKHAISVMRIKGSSVRGITVADTTRTILEETIDHRLNRIAERLQSSSDAVQRKELRSEINLSLSFKESLNEKLLDLQDANDVLSTNFKKMKLFKRDNAELRKEILTLQNNRQETALEHDDVQAEFEAEKARVDVRNRLSANMFDIEAAIQNGRDKAREEGRENEGPEIPLSMLLETVGRDVGSFGGGLLGNVKTFNGILERAAGWLEGRA